MTHPPTHDDPPAADLAPGEKFAKPWFEEDAGDVAPLRRPHGTPPREPDEPPQPVRRPGLSRPPSPPPGRRVRATRPRRRDSAGGGRLLRAVVVVVVGAVVLFVVARGVIDILGDDGSSAGGAQPAGASSAQAWPDDEARAFAVQFARAFLTFSPSHPEYHELAVKPFLAKRLRGAIALPKRGPDQTVSAVTVARARAAGSDRAVVTVASTVLNRTVTTRYLTVPVARDRKGGLVIYDYPAFSAPPPAANVASDEQSPLQGSASGPIRRSVQRFLKAYLAGGDPSAFATPDGRVSSLKQRYDLRKVLDVSQVGDASASERSVVVVVRARDRDTRAEYTLRYRADLVLRRDRWLVQALDGATGQVAR